MPKYLQELLTSWLKIWQSWLQLSIHFKHWSGACGLSSRCPWVCLSILECIWVSLSYGKWYNWAKLERHFDTTCDNCLFRRAWHIDRCLHLQHSTSIVSLLEENWLFENQNLFFIFWSAVYSFIVFSYFPTSLNLWSPSKRSVLRGPSKPHPRDLIEATGLNCSDLKALILLMISEIWRKKNVEVGSWNPVYGTQVLGISEPEPSTETNFQSFFRIPCRRFLGGLDRPCSTTATDFSDGVWKPP